MEIKGRFDHFNINVTDLERSIAFYEKALGLKEHHRKEAADGSLSWYISQITPPVFYWNSPGCETIPKPMNWERTKAIFASV